MLSSASSDAYSSCCASCALRRFDKHVESTSMYGHAAKRRRFITMYGRPLRRVDIDSPSMERQCCTYSDYQRLASRAAWRIVRNLVKRGADVEIRWRMLPSWVQGQVDFTCFSLAMLKACVSTLVLDDCYKRHEWRSITQLNRRIALPAPCCCIACLCEWKPRTSSVVMQLSD